MLNIPGVPLTFEYSIRIDVELRFMLKKLQSQLQAEHGEIKLVKIQEKFPLTKDNEVQLQGKQAGVKQEELDTQQFLHIMRWTVSNKYDYLIGFGYNLANIQEPMDVTRKVTKIQKRWGTAWNCQLSCRTGHID